MTKVVVDASVAIKWLLPEVHSETALHLLDPAISRMAPDLISAELGNILWKKVRREQMSRAEAESIGGALRTVEIVIHPSQDILSVALEFAVVLDRTVYDSLYLALAVVQDCQLVTADWRFHSAVAASPWAPHIRWIGDEV